MTKKNFARLEKKLRDYKKIAVTENYIQLIWKKFFFSKTSKEGLNLPNSVNLTKKCIWQK
jgi:hypothetical protein